MFGHGRKPKTTSTTDRLIQRKLKFDRRKSARTVTSKLEKDLRILISESTVKRRAHEMRLFGRVARKKPYANRTNRLKRLKYTTEMLRKPLDFWDTIVWSDESKFHLFGSNGRTMVWRSRDEEFDPKCTVPTVKHGGGFVMFHEERSWEIGHTGSYNGSLLLQANTGRESATISTAISIWDELHIYA